MKKVALLIDAEWFRRALYNKLSAHLPKGVTADVMYRNAMLAVASDEEALRLFCYDSLPHEGKERNPISKKTIDYSTTMGNIVRKRFFEELGQMELVALRRGNARPRGWTLQRNYLRALMKATGSIPAPKGTDIYVAIEQKGVDMRIGIDVATLSIKKQVDRIVLFSGDCDMIPAMKLARREGVQVVLVAVDGRRLSSELIEDCDIVRKITPIP